MPIHLIVFNSLIYKYILIFLQIQNITPCRIKKALLQACNQGEMVHQFRQLKPIPYRIIPSQHSPRSALEKGAEAGKLMKVKAFFKLAESEKEASKKVIKKVTTPKAPSVV